MIGEIMKIAIVILLCISLPIVLLLIFSGQHIRNSPWNNKDK